MTSLDTLKTFSEKGLDSSLHMTEVMVSLPKFSFSTSYELEKELPKLGLNDPFGSTADFSGITESSQLKISQIIHKAFVEVDETGTKAAAVTAVVMKRALIKKKEIPEFNANHPFLFFLVHKKTRQTLFVGKVMDPTEK